MTFRGKEFLGDTAEGTSHVTAKCTSVKKGTHKEAFSVDLGEHEHRT